jgi:hypothetical protein
MTIQEKDICKGAALTAISAGFQGKTLEEVLIERGIEKVTEEHVKAFEEARDKELKFMFKCGLY